MERGRAAGWIAVPTLHDGAARGTAQTTEPQRGTGPLLSARVPAAGRRGFAQPLEAVVPIAVEADQAGAESYARPGVRSECLGAVALFAAVRFSAGRAREL